MTYNDLNLGLPWNAHKKYWICVEANDEQLGALEKAFKNKGSHIEGIYYAVESEQNWAPTWKKLAKAMDAGGIEGSSVAVIPNEGDVPSSIVITPNLRARNAVQLISENLWLGEAILDGRMECHFQPIMDKKNTPIGYESFVRVNTKDKKIVNGFDIIEASYTLGMEHVIDRYLHTLAIETFAGSGLPGNLFINFMTGFIQLPEKYLEKLKEAAIENNIIPNRIVLDVSKADHVEDISQICSVVEFCHSNDYSVALDDLKSLDQLQEILSHTTPNFVKLDKGLTQNLDKQIIRDKVISMISISHNKGCKVLAEAIEDKKTFEELKSLGADLFQGYYFSKPLPIAQIKKKVKKAS